MKKVLEAMDNRFPCKSSIRFRRISLTTHEGTLDFENYIQGMYEYIEVPYEIVKHIYELGWSDAKDAVKEAIS